MSGLDLSGSQIFLLGDEKFGLDSLRSGPSSKIPIFFFLFFKKSVTKSALASSSIAILRAPKGHREKELRVDFFLVQEPQLGCLVVILYNHCMAYHSRSRNFQIKSAFAELKGGRSPRLAVCSASTRRRAPCRWQTCVSSHQIVRKSKDVRRQSGGGRKRS